MKRYYLALLIVCLHNAQPIAAADHDYAGKGYACFRIAAIMVTAGLCYRKVTADNRTKIEKTSLIISASFLAGFLFCDAYIFLSNNIDA